MSSYLKIEPNSMIPVKIELESWQYVYTPYIFYKEIDLKWVCKYSNIIENKELFRIESESLEELIWKVWEHIEKHEYSEIYDLTYNFKKYELD